MRGNIPALATALGVTMPPAWPASQYDHIWRLKFGAGRVTVEDLEQKLSLP